MSVPNCRTLSISRKQTRGSGSLSPSKSISIQFHLQEFGRRHSPVVQGIQKRSKRRASGASRDLRRAEESKTPGARAEIRGKSWIVQSPVYFPLEDAITRLPSNPELMDIVCVEGEGPFQDHLKQTKADDISKEEQQARTGTRTFDRADSFFK
ncbi:hypothetical protein CDAR_254011 [Caerostris darwini]|uniref:Uncharacterized protein n=1 Tax=Caerostris darwini TaxID=1538125 RepID=A0AAV4S7U6_9ARAC|nr:hypothetical protein CDAR_254011 [Caerostris darwini]